MNGKEKDYNSGGNLIFEGEYINGVRYGKEYDNKGNIIFDGEYFKTKRFNRIEKRYFENGKLKYESEYILGKRKGKTYNEDGNIISLEYLNEKSKIEIMCDSMNENDKEKYKGKEYDMKNNLIFEGEFELGKRIKGKRKIYDNYNNFLFEFDYDKNETKDKKDILLQIKTTYERGNGLKEEKGREINFKDNSIFIGEFINGVKSNGIIKVYNNLKIDEDENINDSEESKSIILILEIVIKNEEIKKKKYFCENKIVLIYEYKFGEIWKEKYYNQILK